VTIVPTDSTHSRSSDSIGTTGSDTARSDGSSSPSQTGSQRKKVQSLIRGVFPHTSSTPGHADGRRPSDTTSCQTHTQAQSIAASPPDDALPPEDESRPLLTIQASHAPSVVWESAPGSLQFGPPASASLLPDPVVPEDNLGAPKPDPKSIVQSAINAGKKVLEIATESSDAFPPLKSALGGIRAMIRTCEVST
jgi:hypothetical protein